MLTFERLIRDAEQVAGQADAEADLPDVELVLEALSAQGVAHTARVITAGTSAKARHVRAGHSRVAVCQVDGRRWVTLEGTAVVRDDPAAVADAEARYARRYRTPRENPARVVLEISVDRVLGNA